MGWVRNHGPERINVGNIVKIEIDSKSRMIAALRVFLLPIVALIIGFVVPQSFIKNQNPGLLGGFFLLVICFALYSRENLIGEYQKAGNSRRSSNRSSELLLSTLAPFRRSRKEKRPL